jgi:hypothetical protein
LGLDRRTPDISASCRPSIFVDRRNNEPTINLPQYADEPIDDLSQYAADHSSIRTMVVDDYFATDFTLHLQSSPLSMPDLPTLSASITAPPAVQRYHVEIWCEKTTMNEVFEPQTQQYGLNLITGAGEQSITACVNLVERAQQSGRPVRILYVSDFDAGGVSMPLAVGRKIEHRLQQEGLDLDIQVRWVALRPDQVEGYNLPRIPMKPTEMRANEFERRYGRGATELDALEAIRPGELERIVTREIRRYRDDTLRDRIGEARDEA